MGDQPLESRASRPAPRIAAHARRSPSPPERRAATAAPSASRTRGFRCQAATPAARRRGDTGRSGRAGPEAPRASRASARCNRSPEILPERSYPDRGRAARRRDRLRHGRRRHRAETLALGRRLVGYDVKPQASRSPPDRRPRTAAARPAFVPDDHRRNAGLDMSPGSFVDVRRVSRRRLILTHLAAGSDSGLAVRSPGETLAKSATADVPPRRPYASARFGASQRAIVSTSMPLRAA